MDPTKLIRNASKVKEALVATPTGQLLAKKPCKIYIPVRFASCKLAVIAGEIRIIGIYAIVVDDKYYGVSTANAMIQLTPSSTSIIKIAGDDNYEFSFDAGAVITPNLNLVKNDILVYSIYDEIVAKGHIPWYFSYSDLGKLFTTSVYHGDIKLAPNNAPLEMIAATISRTEGDKTKYYRESIDNITEESTMPPAFIAFRSIIYGPTNTTAKLMGAYFDEGMLSALNNPSEKSEGVESLLRA